jgi:hypothetical protein
MATAWLDERAPDVLYAARGVGRPLWLGTGRGATFFASTREALQVVERYARIRLRKQEVREGTFLAVRDGDVVRRERFKPDHAYVEADPLPSVRAPQEAVSCLERLNALTAAAA